LNKNDRHELSITKQAKALHISRGSVYYLPQSGKAGKKESTGRRLNRHCPQHAKPSSNSSLGYHRNDARTAANGFAAKGSVNEPAKVVLGRVDKPDPDANAGQQHESRKALDELVVSGGDAT
jgi:hypothetical protein